MSRPRWIVLVVVLLVTLFAVVVGGFLWPRPQFRKGPWTSERTPSADSLESRTDHRPDAVPAP